jgi:hypothetical protein
MKLSALTGGGTCLTVRLWRAEPDGDSNETILREQLDAMSSFAEGWLEPLGVMIDISCGDFAPKVPSWFIRTSNLGDVGAEPTVGGTRIHELATINAAVIGAHVERALKESCSEVAAAAVERIEWTAFRARLPIGGVTELVLNGVELPIERRSDGDWVSGPRARPWTEPPFWFHVGEAELRFDVIWDLWYDGPGRQQIDDAVQRVLARGSGWRVVP